jgi:hypothetical protein
MIRLPHGYELLCAWKFYLVFKYKSIFALYVSYIRVEIKMISCTLFGLVAHYKSVYERHLSRVTIQPLRRYKLLCTWKFSSSIAHSIIIMHIVYVKYDAQIVILPQLCVVNKRVIYVHIYCASYHAVILYCKILVHVKHTVHICIKGSC